MAINRRSLFGIFGGAALAGPKIASSMASSLASEAQQAAALDPNHWRRYGSASKSVGIATQPLWADTADRISDLRKLIAGDVSDEEKRERLRRRISMAEAAERDRLDGLRSVSAQHKRQMFIDDMEARLSRIERMQAETELERLLKIPGLG